MSKLYKTYVFRTKDPTIDELRTLVEDTHGERIRHHHLTMIEEKGGPTAGTMRQWFFGKTRRPQSAAIEAAGRALGYRRKWVRYNGPEE